MKLDEWQALKRGPDAKRVHPHIENETIARYMAATNLGFAVTRKPRRGDWQGARDAMRHCYHQCSVALSAEGLDPFEEVAFWLADLRTKKGQSFAAKTLRNDFGL